MRLLLTLALCAVLTAPAHAQEATPTTTPTAEVVTPVAPATPVDAPSEPIALSTGYTPDPVIITGRTAGSSPMNTRAAGCRGYVGDAPDAIVRLETRFGFLRFFVLAPRAVTLAVRDAAGRWHCSGRPLDGAPREEGSFAPGDAQVWIGATERGAEVPFELRVTEFHSVTPATGLLDQATPVGGGADLGLVIDAEEGRHRGRSIRRGFLPDPRMDDGTSGGEIDTRLLGGQCRGFVSAVPSHVLELRDDFDYFRLQLGEVPGVATLLVRTPGGRWFCSSPEDVNARVDRDAWPAGIYHVWVGSPEAESTRDYRICYTESRPPEGRTLCGDFERNAPRPPPDPGPPFDDPQVAGHDPPDGEMPLPDDDAGSEAPPGSPRADEDTPIHRPTPAPAPAPEGSVDEGGDEGDDDEGDDDESADDEGDAPNEETPEGDRPPASR